MNNRVAVIGPESRIYLVPPASYTPGRYAFDTFDRIGFPGPLGTVGTLSASQQLTMPMPPKAPASTLDYTFDWTRWLDAGEVIQSFTVDPGTCTLSQPATQSSGFIRCWLTGGNIGDSTQIACAVTTNMGRTDSRSFALRITNRTI
ncbi:phage fiber-tail adaptor protein [Burkholderia cenocepacia]|uniref:phage fiber-tail adaptor protein n=2 Tax=Burkholderia cenocepacia TaxID=95486 RepID=UPI001177B9C5|nr:hypothetical protein [Burkholderia cenocepacia]